MLPDLSVLPDKPRTGKTQEWTDRTARLRQSTYQFANRRADYYGQWVFDQPVLVKETTHKKLAHLQHILHKMIVHLGHHYDTWEHLLPLDPRVKSVLSHFRGVPYRTGTFRTDFVIDSDYHPRIIEITCRFALNSFFLNAIYDNFARHYCKEKSIPYHTHYDGFFAYLNAWIGDSNRVYLLRKSETRTESKLFVEILENAGITVTILPPEALAQTLPEMSDSLIINELTFDEILSIPDNLIAQLARLRLLNDYRTVFLVHDKRFFSVIADEAFQNSVLTPEESLLLRDFLVETHAAHQRPDAWEEARLQKEGWIIKPANLGRSANVVAGLVTAEEEWQKTLANYASQNLVLQKWVPQPKVQASIQGTAYEDYAVGTLLYFDDQYFGPAQFRTSSHPITNVVDDRKAFFIPESSALATEPALITL